MKKAGGSYDHKKIEKKWQKVWDDEKTYQTLNAHDAKAKNMDPYYVLDMFPYPSGSGLHVGHPRGYIASDVFARMKRMEGYNVLHPMGFDSFGLPAEQYAIQTGENPGPFTESLVKRYRKQLEILGFSFDWDREVMTHRPEYYQWTQWIFLQIYNSYYDHDKKSARPITELIKKFKDGEIHLPTGTWNDLSELEQQKILMDYRLAYQGYAEVNWCPELGTVLANDEIVDSANGPVSERGGFAVEKKKMRQWFMRITAYGDRLLDGLNTIDWPESIKEIQRNWIGKSEGSEVTFYIENKEFGYFINNVDIFTTRADTLFGVSYIALAVDHPAVEGLLKKEITNWDKVYEYIQQVKKEDPYVDKEITGIKLDGVVAKQSFMDDLEVPVYLTNYVLGNYGTGAVMGVPAHDERDFAFAKKYDLPIKEVVSKLWVLTGEDAEQEGAEILNRKVADPIIKDKDGNFYLVNENGRIHFAGGGIDEGEGEIEGLRREIIEETGFTDFEILEKTSPYITIRGFRHGKNKNQRSIGTAYEVVLNSLTRINSEAEEGKHELVSYKKDEVLKNISWEHHKYLFEKYLAGPSAFTDEGVVFNSNEFDGLTSQEARKKITEFVGGKLVTKYKFRDAIFARQRYWGEPIPLVHSVIKPKLEIEFSGEFRYRLLKEGAKTIEVRALDKKERNDVCVGDILKFTHIEKKESFSVVVKELWNFKNIEDIFKQGSKFFEDIFPGESIITLEDLYDRYAKVAPDYEKRIDTFGAVAWRVEKIIDTSVIAEIPENELPLELPKVKSFAPAGNGESPLATVTSWVKKGYETNTMPGWAGSSWYFLRYVDPKNTESFASSEELDYWFGKENGGVNMYVGGQEHATGHLLYSRFWHKVLKDLGHVKTEEPFKTLRNQGMILGTDGRKMSKRWGNVINPDDVVAQLGADTMRVYEMFMGPFESSQPWSTDGIVGARRFIERVWKLSEKVINEDPLLVEERVDTAGGRVRSLQKSLHKTIKKVSDDIKTFSFNTAISSMMIFLNEVEKNETISNDDFKKFIQILAPFAPHICEELWNILGGEGSIHHALWPTYDDALVIDNTITLGIQINGKVRAEIEIAVDANEESVKAAVLAIDEVQKWLEGKEIKKFIFIPRKIISIVV